LAAGEHVLAISLHNRANGSSDLRVAEISLAGRSLRNAATLDDPHILVDRGRAFLEDRRPERALEDFSQALKLDPDNIHARLRRADVLGRLGKMEEAQAELDSTDALIKELTEKDDAIERLYAEVRQKLTEQ
jgi:tetratricopeptide (TPR) repeat protein